MEGGEDISFRQEEEEEWGKPLPPLPIFKSDSQRERLVGGRVEKYGVGSTLLVAVVGEGSEEALSREILFLELQKCHLEKLFLFQERAQSIPPRIFFIRTDGRGRRKKKNLSFPTSD